MDTSEPEKLNQEATINRLDLNKKKSYRKRRRNFYNQIRTQMEFYFGDSNIAKDRFLKKLLDQNPYVPLETFLSFNKLKALTSNVEDIATALTESKLLRLDETGSQVCRTVPIPVEMDFEEKTLYVESLPPTADHDWVKTVFEQFGKVTYVSLPKFKKTKKIKEFGFVEFDDVKSIEKVINSFQRFNGVLNMDSSDPAELKSIVAYQLEKSEEENEKIDKYDVKRKKRKLSDSAENMGNAKKMETIENLNDFKDDILSNSSDSESENTSECPQEIGSHSNQKRRKKNFKAKKNKTNKAININSDPAFMELKILPKVQWKRLRNKYLNLQRQKAAEIKKQFKQQAKRTNFNLHVSSCDAHVSEEETTPLANKHKISERKLTGMNMNFYGAGEDENCSKSLKEQKNNTISHVPSFTYEPGLIVEVKFYEPCVNIKDFKADMRQYKSVKYVDVKEGSTRAFLRLESSKATTDFVARVSCAEYKCHILSGDSESEYWKKIEMDKEMKLNKQVKVPRKRGRENMKKKLIHLRFGEEV